MNISLFPILSLLPLVPDLLEEVKAPVNCVEEDEGERKHDAGVFVDHVNVLYHRHGALDGGGTLLQRGDDALPAGSFGGVDTRPGREGVVAVDPEGGRELEVLQRSLAREELGVMALPGEEGRGVR